MRGDDAASEWSVHRFSDVKKEDQQEFEFLAQKTRQRSRHGDDDFVDAVRVVECVLGPTAIVYDARLTRHHLYNEEQTFLRRRVDGSFEIALRPGTPDLRFRLLHEVGHVVLAEEGARLSLADEERAANYIAAAIMSPRDLLRRAHAYYGDKLRPIAKTFGMSQTATQLRLGEVLEDERGIVTEHGNVLVRTQGTFPWASVPVVEIARSRVDEPRLVKAVLRGGIDERRVALRARR